MSNSFPYFAFYAADFEIDTRAWPIEAVGAYIRLLIHQWINGNIPEDELQQARIAGCSPEQFMDLWSDFIGYKFSHGKDEFLVPYCFNRRLELERLKIDKVVQQRRHAGIKSGESRKKKAASKQEPRTLVQRDANETATSHSHSHSQKELILSPNGESPLNGVPYDQLKGLYNKICVDLKPFRVVNDIRKRQMRWCWKQKPDLKWWEEKFFPECQGSKFLRGENPSTNHPNWKGNIEYITRQEPFAKIIEGLE